MGSNQCEQESSSSPAGLFAGAAIGAILLLGIGIFAGYKIYKKWKTEEAARGHLDQSGIAIAPPGLSEVHVVDHVVASPRRRPRIFAGISEWL